MNVCILAGGMGTRIAKYFPELPKPMIPLLDKPLLQHQIEMLVNQGFRNITLTIGHKAEIIKDHFGDGEKFGANINYIIEESPLDTGGALSMLPREDTLIMVGDVYCDIDVNRFVDYHRDKGAMISLFVHPNNHPHDSDIIVADDDDRVIAWSSKRDPNHGMLRNKVNAGLHILNAEALPEGEPVRRNLNRDIIVPAIESGKVYAYASTEYVKDMGTIERLRQVEGDIRSGITSARSMKNKQKAIFLDRDGTINVFADLVTTPDKLQLIDGAADAIRRINASEYLAICVTNQPVIARGDVTFEQLNQIHARLDNLLGAQGAYLDDLLFCPHHPDKGFEGEIARYKIDCDCRKPKPGLLLQAARKHNIDLSQSYMVGDTDRDAGAGQAAGCKTFLVDAQHSLLNIVDEILSPK